MRRFSLGLVATLSLLLSGAACDFQIGDLNNPSLEELRDTPTAASLNVACTGLISGHRAGMAAANGYIVQLGILGREHYNFDGADPRYINELLAGTLAKGSPFGGAFWGGPYANIRLANIVINGVDKVAEYSTEQRSALKGFANTFIAADLLRVIVTRDDIGAVIDTNKELGAALSPIASKAEVYTAIAKTLDDAKTQLQAGGTAAFPFPMTAGFTGFTTPPDFLKFNRALRARVAVYMSDEPAALAALSESFLNAAATTQAGLDAGPTFVFSANAGDTANAMTNRNIFAHPSFSTDAQLQADGTTKDDRFVRKIRTVTPAGSGGGMTSNLKFNAYQAATSPVSIIRNEELILLRAEAEFNSGMKTQAIADLNIVRTISGKLAPLTGAETDEQITNEILYNRRYSLMAEGGHRWIDARRLGRIMDIPLDKTEHRRNVRFPIPQAECDARPGEVACTKDSLGGS